ncbi:hypothetical protein ILYODFUR_009082 [Ilyodon furcidens]|uniref:Secreted protein n=1 Tax=Ilyodon furcidens TaxID=33524 RepID=A0ABV0SX49_9TELE
MRPNIVLCVLPTITRRGWIPWWLLPTKYCHSPAGLTCGSSRSNNSHFYHQEAEAQPSRAKEDRLNI